MHLIYTLTQRFKTFESTWYINLKLKKIKLEIAQLVIVDELYIKVPNPFNPFNVSCSYI